MPAHGLLAGSQARAEGGGEGATPHAYMVVVQIGAGALLRTKPDPVKSGGEALALPSNRCINCPCRRSRPGGRSAADRHDGRARKCRD